jgi:hypothetical protein
MKKCKATHIDPEKAKAQLWRREEQRCAQGSLNGQSKKNQNLGFSKERLNINEAKFFIKQAIAILQNSKTKAKKKSAILILLVSFWVSRPIEDVANFRITRRLKGTPSHEGIYIHGGEIYWILHVSGPAVKGTKLTDQSPACKVKKFIQLKISHTLKDLILPHVDDMLGKKSKKLFDETSIRSRPYLRYVLRSIRDDRNERLNLKRIATFLFWELAHHPSSDFATALLISGMKASNKISQPYYTTLGENWLQAIYDNVCSVLESNFKLIETPIMFRDYTRVGNLPEPDVYLGSPFRPERSAVQALIVLLQKEIECFQKKKTWSTQDMIRFQKPYVLYNWLMFSFAGGVRPGNRPCFDPELFNLTNGLAVINDKDQDGREKTRRVWFWDEMCKQIEYYYEHIEVLYDRIGFKVPSLIDLFNNHGSSKAVGHLFIIGENFELEFLKPAWIEKILKAEYNYAMPANSHRHFIRSHLLERECPVETIDAFMGHEKLGQEASGQYSAFFQADLVDSLRKHHMPFLKEDGWRAIPGLTKENRR